MSARTDIVIIGGGLIGASLAYWLSETGRVQITLVEAKAELAGNGTASWASAGIISPPSRMQTPVALLTLIRRTIELYPQLIAKLPQPVGYRELGQLSLAANGAEVRGLQKRQGWQKDSGFEARWLLPAQVDELEPLAGPHVGALYNPAAIVDAARLTRLLGEQLRQTGGTLLTNSPVEKLLRHNEQVTGVQLKSGETIQAERVVLTAGAWSGQWLDTQLEAAGKAPVGFARLVWPVRGQMLAVQPSPETTLNHVLVGGHGYALPQRNGTISYGATVEPAAGFENFITPAGMLELGRLVHKLTPRLETAPIVQSWSGLRPGSADELPLLGPLDQLPGLWLATGHFRNGVLLAPATAELLATALLSNRTEALEPFLPRPGRINKL